MGYQIGDNIGGYEVRGFLGSGGSADVFAVKHSITNRDEAMKVLYGPLDEQRAQRIHREASLQANLNHPNITALHNAFWWNQDLVLVMERIDGESMRQKLEREPIPFDTAIVWARQILLALSHAHQSGIVHRDVSPSNILITDKGRIKLTDFGLAKNPRDRTITVNGAMLGSVYYSSPEQIRSSGEVDQRADIYSCGAVLYELFTGSKPFEGEGPFEVMMAHAQQIPDLPSKRLHSLPSYIDIVLLRAMEKDPQNRYQTAEELLAALLPKQQSQRKAFGFGVPIAASATVAVMLAIVGTVSLSNRVEQQKPIEPPPMPHVAVPAPDMAFRIPIMLEPAAPTDQPSPKNIKTSLPQTNKVAATARKAIIVGAEEESKPIAIPAVQAKTEMAQPQLPAPPETVPTVMAMEPGAPPIGIAKPIETPPEPAARPGFLRGTLRKLNPFRKPVPRSSTVVPRSEHTNVK